MREKLLTLSEAVKLIRKRKHFGPNGLRGYGDYGNESDK